jgi:hypothetical protein
VNLNGGVTFPGILQLFGSNGSTTYSNTLNGYLVLPGQILLRWFTVTFNNPNSAYPYQAVNFPTAFSGSPYAVIGNGQTKYNGNTDFTTSGSIPIVATNGYSSTGCTVRLDSDAGLNFTGTITVCCVAIGPG